MVMIHHKPTIGATVDKLTPLALSALKTLVFEGSNDAADPDVAQERNRRMVVTHTVIAPTGSSMTWVVAFLGISSPAFCRSRM
jgi:hypothetical protein